jgi:hypothetical protein
VDKASINHSLVSSSGKKLYKITQSSYMDNLLRTIIKSDSEIDAKKVFPFLNEGWLAYNHFANRGILNENVSFIKQVTHDGFRQVFLKTSKPTERENTMEYYRRLVTFSYMDTLISSIKPHTNQVLYDQETYQLAQRSRPQSVRMTFLNKQQSREAIINIFRTLRTRPSDEIDSFFAVKNGLTNKAKNSTNPKDQDAYMTKLFSNMSLSSSDSGFIEKDGKKVVDLGNELLIANRDKIMSGSKKDMEAVADLIIADLSDNVTSKMVDEMLLYEMPFHQRLPEVVTALMGLGYMSKDDKDLLAKFMNAKEFYPG